MFEEMFWGIIRGMKGTFSTENVRRMSRSPCKIISLYEQRLWFSLCHSG